MGCANGVQKVKISDLMGSQGADQDAPSGGADAETAGAATGRGKREAPSGRADGARAKRSRARRVPITESGARRPAPRAARRASPAARRLDAPAVSPCARRLDDLPRRLDGPPRADYPKQGALGGPTAWRSTDQRSSPMARRTCRIGRAAVRSTPRRPALNGRGRLDGSDYRKRRGPPQRSTSSASTENLEGPRCAASKGVVGRTIAG
jgi:hypothetical protein